jgi:hypothetical protein
MVIASSIMHVSLTQFLVVKLNLMVNVQNVINHLFCNIIIVKFQIVKVIMILVVLFVIVDIILLKNEDVMKCQMVVLDIIEEYVLTV